MHDVFISYSTKDMSQAETVRDVLEKNGIPCWMAPRDIPGGSNYAREIPQAIRSCQVFVLILSENAQSSNWVVKELDNAVNCGKIILPLMLEDCPLNDEFNFLLTGAQRYAAYQKSAEVLGNLVDRIKAITGTGTGEKAETAQEAPAAPKAPAAAAAPEAPRQKAKTAAPKSAAAPVVHQAKPQKPKQVKEKTPFTFGNVEALAALAIPGMALLSVAGYLLGNYLYRLGSWGNISLFPGDEKYLAFYAVTGALIGALMWWEWIRFRHREQNESGRTLCCPQCGSDAPKVSTFLTRPMGMKERLISVLGLFVVIVCMYAQAVVGVLAMELMAENFLHPTQIMSMFVTGIFQGLVLGGWICNLLVRRMRRRAGLRSTVCRCKNCRATFLPVLK